MSRFSAGTNINPEIRYDLQSAAYAQPDLFIRGDAVQGFDVTAAPPELGFWGVTFHDKQINASTIESGNVPTWVFNNVIDPLVPGEQRFVSLGAGLLMREAVTGEREEIDGYRALSNRISPVVNVAELDKVLTFRDENFDAKTATAEWLDNQTNGELVQLAARHTGRDLEAILGSARNRQHFHYLQMRELTHAQAMQDLTQWEDDAGFGLKWSSRVSSFVGNYLLTDPSFLPSMFIGVGELNAAGKALQIGPKVIRLSAPVVGGQRALAAGRAADALLRSPKAIHAGLVSHLGHRAAVAVEIGAYGGAFDLAVQQQRIAESEILLDDPEHQQHFSWAELGLSVVAGGTLGFALAGRGGTRLQETRRASIEAAGGNPSSPLSYSFDNVRGQVRMDTAGIRVQRAAANLMGDDFDSAAMYLDDALLSEVGLHRFQIADAMEELVFAAGDQGLPAVTVHRVLSDMLSEARKVKGLSDDLIGSAAGSQLEQAALAEAMGRAARELPQSASNSDVLARAASLIPEELQRIEKRMFTRAAQARAAGEGELAYWTSEASSITEAASRRSLTEAEIDYMGTISGKLESLGQSNPFEGFAVSRSRRYQDGTIFAPFRATASASPLTKAVEKVGRTRRQIAELEGARTLGDTVTADLRNARKRLARAQKQVQSLSEAEADRIVTEAGSRVREVSEKWIANPPKNQAEKFRALDEMAAAVDFSTNALIEDGTMMGRLIQGWGLRSLRTIAQQGTGMDQTVRSTLGVLREIAHEFDPSKLRVGDLDPLQSRVHRSLEEIRTDMSVRISEMADQYKQLHDAGKFGSSLRIVSYTKRRGEFDKEVIHHVTGTRISEDPDVIAFSKLWQRNADEIGKVADEAGMFKQLDNFFPRRWQIGRVLKDPDRFIDSVARHFRKQWEESDEVHLDTLVSMGKARRLEGEDGPVRWDVDGIDNPVDTLPRTALGGLGITDEAYLGGMRVADDSGLSPMHQAATRTRNNLTGDDSFEETANGRLRRKTHGAPRSEATRRLEESVWTNPELEDFLDFRLMHGAASYLQSTGFRVMNSARHQKRWGIPRLTMEDTLDWVETRVARDIAGDPIERGKWRDGIKTLREKLHLAEGRLPTLRDQTSGLGEWLGDVGTALAGSLYGSGIGQAVLTTEVMQAIVSRVYGPSDIVRRVGDIFKVAARNRQDMREQIQALGLTARQYRTHTLERLTGDAVYSEGFQFGLFPKVLAPFLDAFNAALKRDPSGRTNKTAALVRAHAATSMTLGGMDYFTQFARMLHVQSSLDEMGRFFRAAEKTSVALQEGAKDLTRIERTAYDAVLTAGKSEKAARQAGRRARFKAWVGIARANGFGGNWQVAEKMQRAGLLDARRLAALRRAGDATGALQDTGTFKTLDFNQMMRYTGGSAEEMKLFNESFTSMRDMIVDTIHKRVSEQNILQAPASQASRTWLGRTQLAMTSFARSWYDNNILDMAQMPLRASVGLISTYLIGETMNMMMRDLWRGRSIEDTLADVEADPDNFVARSLTRLPLLGAWNSLAMPAADALTKNGRTHRLDTGESAAEGAIAQTMDIVFDSVHGAISEDEEVKSTTWRTAARFMPGYRSWWASLLATGAERAGVLDPGDLPGGDSRGSRHTSKRRRRVDIEQIPDEIQGEVLPEPRIPEDLSFLYPEQS